MTGYFGFDMGLALLSEVDKDGFIGIQVDAYGEQKSGVETYEAHFPLGFYARPMDPEKDANGEAQPSKSCTVLYALEGGQGHAWPLNDPRIIAKLPPGSKKKGGSVFYSPATSGYAMWEGIDPKGERREGSFMLAVKAGSQAGAKAALLSFDCSKDGKETITIAHWLGQRIELRDDGSIYMIDKSGKSYVQITGDGIILNGDVQIQGTLTVGDAGKAAVVGGTVMSKPLIAFLTQLCTIVAATGPTKPGTEASALIGQLKTIVSDTTTAS